jgi:sporulation inhibitor KapD
MKKIIYDINYKDKIFYIIYQGRKTGFYLTNKLAKTFFQYLRKGVLVDFEISPKIKKIGKIKYYQVAFFHQIASLNPYFVHYDLSLLRDEMKQILLLDRHYLFIDFEMTMPGYIPKDFKPEIIQVGYTLAKPKSDIIKSDGYYVLPSESKSLSKRTRKFLHLDEETFFNIAKPYEYFYHELEEIIKTYQPKLVVWGKNDLSALNDSYFINQKPKLVEDHDFIDLLKLHKDYYNLKDDLGLFKAYKTYYHVDYDQLHDAKDDALITKYVFDAFLDYM